jgi:hypothetical protein
VSVLWKSCLPSSSLNLFMSWRRFHGNGGSVDCHLIGETVILWLFHAYFMLPLWQ